jgi:hypothetical protein
VREKIVDPPPRVAAGLPQFPRRPRSSRPGFVHSQFTGFDDRPQGLHNLPCKFAFCSTYHHDMNFRQEIQKE